MNSEPLQKIGSITSTNGAEIAAFDSASDRLFVVAGAVVEVQNISSTGSISAVGSLLTGFTPPAGTQAIPNSVAVKNGIVAVAYAIQDTTTKAQQPGRVSFYQADTGAFLNAVTVGALPDMLTFTPDGNRVLVANEGEPNSYGQVDSVDPEGSVSVINIAAGVGAATVHTADFTSFNSKIDALKAAGVRIFGPGATVAQDLEPEYIAVSPDGLTAWVTLQENNAIATLDIATAKITQIVPLGAKNHNLPGNGIDASDRDLTSSTGKINIQPQPVVGLYQPDAIASFSIAGQAYYITANEGDARDYTGFAEEARVGAAGYVLDSTKFPTAATLKQNANLGRLTVTTATGDTDGDGDFDRIEAFGSRSFSIWDASGKQVFDSGDQLEQITAKLAPTLFNSDGAAATFDTRSDNKGPEPEGVVVGVIDNRTYAFIGLERTGDVIVYDVTSPTQPKFIQYINTPEDTGTEGLTFVSAADSPTGKPLLVTANEVSKTVALFEVSLTSQPVPNPEPFRLQLLHFSDQEAGIPALEDAPRLSAVLTALKNQDGSDADTLPDFPNTLILSSGDAYIPGAFLNASELGFGGQGRADILIQNELGVQAITFGNHEFDLGTTLVANLLKPGAAIPATSTTPAFPAYPGAAFPYLSGNLNFAPDANLAPLVTADGQEASTIPGKIAASTVITVNGERIGVVGATTPTLRNISSPGNVGVTPTPFGGTPSAGELDALAAEIQTDVNALLATNPTINKVIVMAHMQQISIETELAKRLKNVDIIMAGGSNTRLFDSNDVLRAGDTNQGQYPTFSTDADGKPIALINTDGNYKYVGRLVVDFDASGNIIPTSYNPTVSGAYATNAAGVAALGAQALVDPEVQAIVDKLKTVVAAQDGAIFGHTDVFLNGSRNDVRTQETNFGNLSADANLAIGKGVDPTVAISIKNGGGIRDNIGAVTFPTGGTNAADAIKSPPAANPLANKAEGDISQLDITNSLRFNNGLTLVTLTAAQLLQTIEHSVAGTAPGATPGQFGQFGGVKFSFDPTRPVGDRVLSLTVEPETPGGTQQVVVQNGEVVGNPSRTFRIVTLNFLASGGDNYPFPAFQSANPTLFNRVDLLGELDTNSNGFEPTEDLNGNGKQDAPIAEPSKFGKANFASFGSEQDALAEYLVQTFPNASKPFTQADTAPALDERIQNLAARQDTVIAPPPINPTSLISGTTGADNLIAGVTPGFDGINDMVFTGAGNDSVDIPLAGAVAGNNRIDLGSGNDTIFVGNSDRAFGSVGDDTLDATDAKDYRLSGGEGNDTIFLGANGRALAGNGNDKLFVGSGGGNFLSGGAGADQFWIANAEIPSAANTILDFQIGTDVIGIQGAKSLGISATTIGLTQVGSDTAINFGGQTLAILTGIQATSLTPSNTNQFVFA